MNKEPSLRLKANTRASPAIVHMAEPQFDSQFQQNIGKHKSSPDHFGTKMHRNQCKYREESTNIKQSNSFEVRHAANKQF